MSKFNKDNLKIFLKKFNKENLLLFKENVILFLKTVYKICKIIINIIVTKIDFYITSIPKHLLFSDEDGDYIVIRMGKIFPRISFTHKADEATNFILFWFIKYIVAYVAGVKYSTQYRLTKRMNFKVRMINNF